MMTSISFNNSEWFTSWGGGFYSNIKQINEILIVCKEINILKFALLILSFKIALKGTYHDILWPLNEMRMEALQILQQIPFDGPICAFVARIKKNNFF